MLPESPHLLIEVVYAAPQRAIVKSFRLRSPATVADALALAAADPDFDGVDIASGPVGIYGEPAPRDQLLRDADRIEIYRALAVDPKAARRARAKQARSPRPR